MNENSPYLLAPYYDIPTWRSNDGTIVLVVMGNYKFNRDPIFLDGKPVMLPVKIEKVTNYLERGGYPITHVKIKIARGNHVIRIEGQTEYPFLVK